MNKPEDFTRDRSPSLNIELSDVFGASVEDAHATGAVSAMNPMLNQASPEAPFRDRSPSVNIELYDVFGVSVDDADAAGAVSNPMLNQAIPFRTQRQGDNMGGVETTQAIEIKDSFAYF